MAGCTIKESTYLEHDRLHLFLFSSEKLEKPKRLKLVVSHLSTFFYFEPLLFIHTKYKDNIHIYIYIYIYIYTYIYIYVYI